MGDTLKQAFAVTGYVNSATAKEISAAGWVSSGRHVDVSPDPAHDDVAMRVPASSVASVRSGADEKGRTLVQIILKDPGGVETIVKHKATAAGLLRFHDPVISQLLAVAVPNKIFV